jgi:hypothetical protein
MIMTNYLLQGKITGVILGGTIGSTKCYVVGIAGKYDIILDENTLLTATRKIMGKKDIIGRPEIMVRGLEGKKISLMIEE